MGGILARSRLEITGSSVFKERESQVSVRYVYRTWLEDLAGEREKGEGTSSGWPKGTNLEGRALGDLH